MSHTKHPTKLATIIAHKTSDAHSVNRYRSWIAVVDLLLRNGYNATQTECIVRSKFARWAADKYGAPYTLWLRRRRCSTSSPIHATTSISRCWCNCRSHINTKLAEKNARLAIGFTLSGNPVRSFTLAPPQIVLEKVDKTKRGKLPILCSPAFVRSAAPRFHNKPRFRHYRS